MTSSVHLKNQPVLYESHMHTPLCKHARGLPQDYAAIAENRGLKGIIVTCHNPVENWGPNVRMNIGQFEEYVNMVDLARKEWKGRIDIRLGLESDYTPGMEPWLEDLHQRVELHHVLGSVHPHLAEYQDRYFKGNMQEFQKTYFNHLALAAETGLFDTLAHPDLVKHVAPSEWDLNSLKDHIRSVLDRIAATETAMELNTSGLYKFYSEKHEQPIPEMNPRIFMLQEMQHRQIPVVIGADAHDPSRVGDRFEEGFKQLKQVGYQQVSIFLNRQRQDIELNQINLNLVT